MIGAGHVWLIASARVDGIAAGLSKNSPLMHEAIDRRVRAFLQGLARSNRRARRQARLVAERAVTLALSEAPNCANLTTDCERLLARGTREIHRPREARGIVLERLERSAAPRSEAPQNQTHRWRSLQTGSHQTAGTVRERTNYRSA